MKEYLIQLDSDNYDWNFLWNNTIKGLKKFSIKMEIVCCILPILMIQAKETDYEAIKEVVGVKTVEDNREGYFIALGCKDV